ncbi:ATPase AAA [Anopheles sinensis]|uniref:ATPase AAA n=1 Tax=Anopheles sinensis TaxID=74873 RepID=A0A084WU14_ANOSI|nr:ATPase AAA [Anopheles sinensis]
MLARVVASLARGTTSRTPPHARDPFGTFGKVRRASAEETRYPVGVLSPVCWLCGGVMGRNTYSPIDDDTQPDSDSEGRAPG